MRQKHRKLIILSKKIPEKFNPKKPRDRRLSEALKSLYSQIKDLSQNKTETCKYLLSLIDKEIQGIDKKVEMREDYLIENKIRPATALEFLEKQEITQSLQCTSTSKLKNAQIGRKSSKNKFGSDSAS